MQNRVPTPRDQRPPLPDFTPVPRKYRYDGWTPERQRAFIEALADTGSVKAACHRINMSQVGAYYLRRQPGAEEFRAAWTAALDFGVQSLVDIAIDRAKEGVPVPVFYKGAQVGERRWYNDRLLMFILKHHMPNKYGLNLSPGTKHPDTLVREAEEEGEEALDRVRERLARLRENVAARYEAGRAQLRRIYYDRYAHDPEKRAAWETLHGRAIETLLEPPPALSRQVLEQGGPDQWALTEDWLDEPLEDD
jgi:hypothetical protein